jgi:hypothetical protein
VEKGIGVIDHWQLATKDDDIVRGGVMDLFIINNATIICSPSATILSLWLGCSVEVLLTWGALL